MAFTDDTRGNKNGLIVGGIAIVFGQLTGASLLVPILGSALGYFVVTKVRPKYSEAAKLGMALLFGHGCWMIVGAIALPGMLDQVLVDIIAASVIFAFLLWRLSKIAIGLLLVLEIVSLLVNLSVLAISRDFPVIGAILAHIVIRGAIVFNMFKVWRENKGAGGGENADIANAFD